MSATKTQSKSALDQLEPARIKSQSRRKGSEDASVISNDELSASRSGSAAPTSASVRRDSLAGISRTYSNKEKLHCEYFEEEKNLDDGDLPTLTVPIRRTLSSVSATSSVSSIRARRLSPAAKSKHRAFWNQLEVDQDSDEDEGKIRSGSKNNRNKSKSAVVEEDGDEEGGFISVILNICNAFGGGDEPAPSNNTGNSHTESKVKKREYNDDDSYDDDSRVVRSTPKRINGDTKKGVYPRSTASTYDEDENTAIEVEYVHRNYDDDYTVSSSQNKFLQLDSSGQVASYVNSDEKKDDGDSLLDEKNAYLRAMTAKAKEDFQRKKGLSDSNQMDEHPSSTKLTDSNNVDWSKSEFKGWGASEKERYIELLKISYSPKDAWAVIASSPTLQTSPSASDPSTNNSLPIVYSSMDEDRDSVMLARSVVSDLSMSSAFKAKKSAYRSMKGSRMDNSKPTPTLDDMESDHSNNDRNIKLASNLLTNLTRRKDAQWMEIQENAETEFINDQSSPTEGKRERRVQIKEESTQPTQKETNHHMSHSNHESVKFDPYRDSSEASVITSPVGGAGDAMSVVSGSKSVYTTDTNATGASAWTVRSRKKPKGAAKKRAPDEHLVELKKPAGWVETIQAAAEKTNQVWDPNLGWVNYSDPERPLYELESDKIGTIKSPVSSRAQNQGVDEDTVDDDTKSESSHVPFPSHWERERRAMMNGQVDCISETENDIYSRHTNASKASMKPALIKKVGSFRKDKSGHLLNVEEEEEDFVYHDNLVVNMGDIVNPSISRSHADNTIDFLGGKKMKKSIVPLEKPSDTRYIDSNTNSSEELYKWIGKSDNRRSSSRDSDNFSDVVSQPDSIEMNRFDEKPAYKRHEVNQLRNDFRGMKLKDTAPIHKPSVYSMQEDDTVSDTMSQPDPIERNRFEPTGSSKHYRENNRVNESVMRTGNEPSNRGLLLNSIEQRAKKTSSGNQSSSRDLLLNSTDLRAKKTTSENQPSHRDQLLKAIEQRAQKISSLDYSLKKNSSEDRSEDDDPFHQVNEVGSGEDNYDLRVSKSGSFDNGFRVIKSTRNMSDYMKEDQPHKNITPKNRSTESDARSVSSQNSESLDRAKEWRKKLEAKIQAQHEEKNDRNENKATQKKGLTQSRSQDHGPIFVSADDASTFDFPKQKQTTSEQDDSIFGFKKTKVEMQRNQEKLLNAAPASSKKTLNNSNDTLNISIPNDSSSVSSLSRDVSKVHAQNYGIDSILSRLQACAGTMPESTGVTLDMCPVPVSTHENQKPERNELPQAHLEFLLASRNKNKNRQPDGLASSGLLMSFCGRPDTIFEEDDEAQRTQNLSSLRPKVNTQPDRSPVEQTRMPDKAPPRFSSSHTEGSPIPSIGLTRSKSEKWQQFVDKRSTSDASVSSRKSSVSDISKAAEKFASKKVEEIMKEFNKDVTKEPAERAVRSRSAKAAEYLAATRVQAMMSSYRSEE